MLSSWYNYSLKWNFLHGSHLGNNNFVPSIQQLKMSQLFTILCDIVVISMRMYSLNSHFEIHQISIACIWSQIAIKHWIAFNSVNLSPLIVWKQKKKSQSVSFSWLKIKTITTAEALTMTTTAVTYRFSKKLYLYVVCAKQDWLNS